MDARLTRVVWTGRTSSKSLLCCIDCSGYLLWVTIAGIPRIAAAVRDASGSNVEIVRMPNRCVNTNENDSQQYYWGVIDIFTVAGFYLTFCYLKVI